MFTLTKENGLNGEKHHGRISSNSSLKTVTKHSLKFYHHSFWGVELPGIWFGKELCMTDINMLLNTSLIDCL